MADLGTRIKQRLEEKQMSQKELADKVACTEAAISLYVKGKRIPRASVLSKIAEALDTTVEYLTDGTPVGTRAEIGYARKLIARNVHQMTKEEKMDILNVLMGDDDE